MPIVDYVLLAILAYFLIWGFRKGFAHAAASIIGIIVAVVLASRYFEELAQIAAPYIRLEDNINLARIIVFIALLILINRLIVFLAAALLKTLSILPLVGFFNSVLGAVAGVLEGALFLGLIIYFAGKFPFGSIVEKFLIDSQVAPILLSVVSFIQPFIPEALRRIEGLI